jgi:Raf kinase inhibitor-like YbhB/YbcL family protein
MKKISLFILSVIITICTMCMLQNVSFAQEDTFRLTSPAFKHNEMIPQKYTCQGEDVNPPLVIENIPERIQSLILIVDDPDAPMGTWDHWLVYDIPPTNKIEEDSIPGAQSKNDFGKLNYGGPCPPWGTHRYYFKLYALDAISLFKEMPTKKDLESAIKEHLIAKTEFIGLYKKIPR